MYNDFINWRRSWREAKWRYFHLTVFYEGLIYNSRSDKIGLEKKKNIIAEPERCVILMFITRSGQLTQTLQHMKCMILLTRSLQQMKCVTKLTWSLRQVNL